MTAPASGTGRRPLPELMTEQQVIEEVTRLRQGYVQHGKWTLAQICWHVGRPLVLFMNPPEPMDLQPTPEQAQKKGGFVDHIINTRTPPPGTREAPPMMIPPPDAGEGAIDEYITALRKLQQYPHPKVMMGPLGPVTAEEFRLTNVFHAAHHLSFVSPKYQRRTSLRFATSADVKADIATLRRGYAITGTWTLPQICWHLEQSMLMAMRPAPFPQDSDEQKARAEVLNRVLAEQKLPGGLTAPPQMQPPANTPEAAIDSMLSVLDELEAYPDPLYPHRLFGTLPNDVRRRLNLIHCANHLSYLVPIDSTP